ncbi:type III secretionT3S chaperone [Parachlamydia acanthamoebae UV-7]|uniref:Type III secretionT3S chaperone n=2 Tax=Parachlamydia acanthamoebae TaxID=83552 RepID=F8L1U0_PARAV|nr:hypothetical protein [Parachlamydia acanthamoebae]CCB87254.1 type III secretionT3S chaperone [Parachlamydia acanthamoebae UV-7]
MATQSISSALFGAVSYLSVHGGPAVKEAVVITQKVANFGIRFFPIIQGGGYVGYGLKVFIWDGLRNRIRLHIENKGGTIGYVSQVFQGFYARIKSIQFQTTQFSFLYGFSAIGAGGCGIASGICRLSYQGLSCAANILGSAARGFFMFGDILSLQYYVNVFFSASELAKSSSGDTRQVALKMRISAGLGIFICFAYLLAGALALFGAPIGVAFAIGCVAGLTSCLKGLFDFFYRNDLSRM